MLQKRAGFPRTRRLRDADSYNYIFKRPKRSVDEFFTILWRTNKSDQSRLGLAIAKKNLKRAVDRNLVKRIVRESYRHQPGNLHGIDLVVLCRKGLPLHDKRRLRESLDRLWQRVARSNIAGSGNSANH